MHPKLVGLNQLKNEMEAKEMDVTFVNQLINEFKWKQRNGFEAAGYNNDTDLYEVYYMVAGDEVEYFECDSHGDIHRHQIKSEVYGEWKDIKVNSVEKRLYPNLNQQIKNDLARAVEKYAENIMCQMLEAKERKAGII